jgi:ATP-dependent RNA helicase DHX57
MVKKGQARGAKPGAGGSKEPALSLTLGEDFIIFTNSNKEPKSKKPSGGDTTGKAVTTGLDGPALAGEAPKRPDVKKIIGGASWTGKLPVNILAEHCQKQKWEKPEYTMVCIILSRGVTMLKIFLVQDARGILVNGHFKS